MGKVDVILKGGIFPTVPGAEAIAIGEGKIVALGREEEILAEFGGEAEMFDLAGRPVLPGFIDSHTHLLQTGLSQISFIVDLSNLSREETLAALEKACRDRGEGEWVTARGWDEGGWNDHTYLTRMELDRVSPRNPLIVVRVDGHLLTANSTALRLLPPELDRSSIDMKDGIIREDAAFELIRKIGPDRETLAEALRAAACYANRLGITSGHTMLHPARIRPYMHTRGRIKLRVTLYPEITAIGSLESLGIETGFGDEWLRIGGVKLFADGSIGAGNAAVSTPYVDTGGNGVLNYTDNELLSFLRRAEEANLQTAIHAIGDRAIEQVLQAHACIGTSPELRHRIEHFELPTEEQIERAKKLGLCVSMQPNFVSNWSGPDKMYERRLGNVRDQRIDPHRLVLDAGIPLAFGSDCMPLSPLYGLHAAVNAPHPEQRVPLEEGIRAYTRAGAYFSHEENLKGAIAPGMFADLIVLERDPRAVPEEISDLSVEMTFVGGELVYKKEDT